MRDYVVKRLLQAGPLILCISVVCFALMHLAPGGPLATLENNPDVRPEDVAIKRKLLGLDEPLPVQYLIWLKRTATGDLGTSFVTGEPVLGMILGRVPATLELMLTAFAIALSLGLAIGIAGALRRAGALDYAVTFFAFIGISIPVFWLGLIAQIVFAVKLGWLPTSGRLTVGAAPSVGDLVLHLILPATVLSLLYLSSWSRYVRSSLIEALGQDYVRTARAKGQRERVVVLRHALRNALIPFVTVVALQVPSLFTGAVITEAVFGWPGMGSLFLDGVEKGDYPRSMGILLISSSLIVLFNLIADVLYGVLDPRIRYQ